MNKTNKVLIISVHPDDETLGAGGTILKLRDQGYEIYWLIVTSPDKTVNLQKKKIILSQIDSVYKSYKFKDVIKMNFPAQNFENKLPTIIYDKLMKIIQKIKPNIIFSVSPEDNHTEHKFFANIFQSVVKPFYCNFINQIFLYNIISSSDSGFNNSNNRNCFSDISRYIDKKIEILKLYSSEIHRYPHPRSISSIKALDRYQGSIIGVEYAETFNMVRYKF